MTSISLTSGNPSTSSRTYVAPNAFRAPTGGTSSGGSSIPRLPGADCSKISPSFWLTWRRAFLIRSANASLPGEHVTTVLRGSRFQLRHQHVASHGLQPVKPQGLKPCLPAWLMSELKLRPTKLEINNPMNQQTYKTTRQQDE